MKIVVLNFSGNVGKSTIVSNMLKPRLPDAKLYSIESINMGIEANGIDDVEVMKGKKFGALIEELLLLDDAIIDVGASNVEDFIKLMNQYKGSHEDFDMYIVPTTKENKIQADTVNTIRTLKALGIKANHIHLVFNKIDIDDNIEDDFAALIGLQQSEKSFTYNNKSVIYNNEVFQRLRALNTSLSDLVNDKTDFRAQIKTAKTEDEKYHLASMLAAKRLSLSANENLDVVYKTIFK